MQTNDNEYFRSAVTDEWNTPRPLTGQEQAEEQKQQTFRTKRHKTAQRAFSLAAPVADGGGGRHGGWDDGGCRRPLWGLSARSAGKENCHFYDGILGRFLYERGLNPRADRNRPRQTARTFL